MRCGGIYTDLNLVVSRPFNYDAGRADLNPAIASITDFKTKAAIGFFDPQVQALQKQYATDLLGHVNPYTGRSYAQEPAVAFLEINNENGMLQAWMQGQLDSLPAYYANELNALWNQWLGAKYADDAALQTAWGAGTQPMGLEMLANGEFTSSPYNGWWLNVVAPSVATMVRETGVGPAGHADACRIDITTAEPANTWHVQMTQSGFAVLANQAYTLTFWAKASTARTINANVGMNHDPWSSLGFSTSVALGTNWQQYTYTFTVSPDSDARMGFDQLAASTGSVWLAGVSLKPGGIVGLYPGEVLGTMRNFLYSGELTGRTSAGRKDWMQFLLKVEEDYYLMMRSHLKTALGAKPLIFGSIVGCTTPNIAALFDVVDTHAYWQHPSFPGTSWSTTDWYVNNLAMADSVDGNTLSNITMKRVLGKPHAVTEYNHPAPIRFQAEAMPFLAVYSSLQDYDAVFSFDYAGWRSNLNTRYSVEYFDVDQNPSKMALFTSCALAFRRFDIAPAQGQVVASMDRSTELEKLLTAGAWSLVDASSVGVSPREALIHRVALAVEGQSVPIGSLSPAASVPGPVFSSDTGQIVWDTTGGNGVVSVDSPRSKMVFGWGGGRTFSLSGITFTPAAGGFNSGWGVWALSAMDGAGFADATSLVLTAMGGVLNTGQILRNYDTGALVAYPPAKGLKLTSRAAWGSAPSRVDVPGVALDLPYASSRVRFFACDSQGNTSAELAVADQGGLARVMIDGSEQSVWFQVKVDQSMFSPTVTPSISETPTATPSHSESPTPSESPTISITPSPFPTRTFTPTNTPSSSVTPTRSATPSATPSPTRTASPSSSATPSHTGTPTATDSAIPTETSSDTATPSASQTESPSVSPTPTASDTDSASPTSTQTPSVTDTPWLSPTFSATVSPMPMLAATLSWTATAEPAGLPEIQKALAWPNPGARSLSVKMAAPAQKLSVRLWTVGYTLACSFEAQSLHAGWNTVALPQACILALPHGLYYVTLQASNGEGTNRGAILRLMI
jgi:hypothetical protein